jgi:RNA-directed DNA polymerase
MAAKLVLEPIFEADFLPCSYGFQPKRSGTIRFPERPFWQNTEGHA